MTWAEFKKQMDEHDVKDDDVLDFIDIKDYMLEQRPINVTFDEDYDENDDWIRLVKVW